ncbi:hypothetical protein AYO21_03897 [Fonsecaea monophora]|uniref:Uncharacterized protein n=1 Tax=Fonsecaea monophora TaxID=254056 RepID=A0A177FC98_9EURO|nr:hypothetical protein AYO21_03897 [Fonsecaea monophora]KAH0840568.1 hypothetical protein FOPE_05943 [Fonsecaea pedrosoi]OAG41894.1 hypothetical protein AYO21_03897 [Fonsecaea monophora]
MTRSDFDHLEKSYREQRTELQAMTLQLRKIGLTANKPQQDVAARKENQTSLQNEVVQEKAKSTQLEADNKTMAIYIARLKSENMKLKRTNAMHVAHQQQKMKAMPVGLIEMVMAEHAQLLEANRELKQQNETMAAENARLQRLQSEQGQHVKELEQHVATLELNQQRKRYHLEACRAKIGKLTDTYLYNAGGTKEGKPYKDLNQVYPVFLNVFAELEAGLLYCLMVSDDNNSDSSPSEQARLALDRVFESDPVFSDYLGDEARVKMKEELTNIFHDGLELFGRGGIF